MTNLYNRCIETSTWPALWKRGELTPIFKKGDKHNVENYRPITTLSIIDKAFESLLSKQIIDYFDPTLSPRLTEYRKNHSCETTLVRLTEDWKHAIDRKELVTILSIDMSKALDSLCHNLTIKKLKAYGFTNQSLDLIRSFLNDRYSHVKLQSWKKVLGQIYICGAFSNVPKKQSRASSSTLGQPLPPQPPTYNVGYVYTCTRYFSRVSTLYWGGGGVKQRKLKQITVLI